MIRQCRNALAYLLYGINVQCSADELVDMHTCIIRLLMAFFMFYIPCTFWNSP